MQEKLGVLDVAAELSDYEKCILPFAQTMDNRQLDPRAND